MIPSGAVIPPLLAAFILLAFEHYRNDTLVDAEHALAPFVAPFQLTTLTRLQAGRNTSNQWLLHVRVDGSAAPQAR